MTAPENSTRPPRDTRSAKTIKPSMLSSKHLCCSCSHSPAAPVSTDSPCNDHSTFASPHCMNSCAIFAMTADKLYREHRNTCPVQLGHCLCMLGIVLSLVCFFSFLPLPSCLLLPVDPSGHTVMLLRIQTWRKAESRDSSPSAELTPWRREDSGNHSAHFQTVGPGCVKHSKGAAILLRYKARPRSWGKQEKKC